MADRQDQQPLENAVEIIQRFGGIRPMSHKIGIPVTTIQGWKKRNVIPGNRRNDVLEAAEINNIDLSDMLEQGIANENSSEAPVESVSQTPPSESERKQVVKTVQRSTKKPKPRVENESFLNEIKAMKGDPIDKSTWVWGPMFLFLLAATVGLAGIVTVLPTKQKMNEINAKIAFLSKQDKSISSNINELQDGQFHLMGLLPDNLEAKVAELQKKADTIKTTVSRLSTQAGALSSIASDVLAEDAGPLSVRIARLEKQLETLTGSSYGLTTLVKRINSLQQTVEGQAQLSRSFDALYSVIVTTDEEKDLDIVLQDKIAENETLSETLAGVSQEDMKAAALLLVLTKFRNSLNRSAPFTEDLMLMQRILGDQNPALNEAITRLAPRAQDGVLTTEGLSKEFRGLAGDIVISSLKGEDVSVREKAKARFHDILQVEKDGEIITGTDTQATVIRAQRLLDKGQIKEAITELQSLDDEAARTAQPWITEAEFTLDANTLQEILTGNILSRTSAGIGNIGAIGSGIGNMGSSALYTTKTLGMKTIKGIQRQLPGGSGLIIDKESGFVILPQPKRLELPDLSSTLEQ